MTLSGVRRTLMQIAAGYTRSLQRVAWGLLLLAIAVVASAAMVFPLWYLAIHDRAGYTIAVLAVLAGALLFLVFRKTQVFWRLSARERAAMVRKVIGRALSVLVFLVAAYVVAGFYVVRAFAVALPLTVIYLFALGYTLYARKSRKRQ